MRVRWRWISVAVLVLVAAACFRPSGRPVIINDFRCPVDGSRYTDTYGPRADGSFHAGIDMLAPSGTPLWAVKDGNLVYGNDIRGGLIAFLVAVDGNVYFYAHMSGFVGGGDRRVAQGDPIGLVGQTGNATAPHLHFEIRIGSVLARGTNPYQTLQNAGC
jgi:murein DD-endopeptidase MepM/ murein hydrolase activator NlpD